jgi:hypothetical protein
MNGIKLRSATDLAAALLFASFGLLGLWLAGDLRIGTAMRMGPGYMPRLLCWILLGFSALVAVRAFTIDGPVLEKWHVRPLLMILFSIWLFAVLIDRIGLVGTVLVAAVVSALATAESRRIEVAILAFALSVFSAVVFVRLLGLPMDLWPEFLVR